MRREEVKVDASSVTAETVFLATHTEIVSTIEERVFEALFGRPTFRAVESEARENGYQVDKLEKRR